MKLQDEVNEMKASFVSFERPFILGNASEARTIAMGN